MMRHAGMLPVILGLAMVGGMARAGPISDVLALRDTKTGGHLLVTDPNDPSKKIPLGDLIIHEDAEDSSVGLTFEQIFFGTPGTRRLYVTEAGSTSTLSDIVELEIEEVNASAHRSTFTFTVFSDPHPELSKPVPAGATVIGEDALAKNPDITSYLFPAGSPNITVYFQSDIDGQTLVPIPEPSGLVMGCIAALGGWLVSALGPRLSMHGRGHRSPGIDPSHSPAGLTPRRPGS